MSQGISRGSKAAQTGSNARERASYQFNRLYAQTVQQAVILLGRCGNQQIPRRAEALLVMTTFHFVVRRCG